MKEVSPEEVYHMAKLSRLNIDEDEVKLFSRQFTQILDHMNILSRVDTEGVEPCYTPVNHSSLLREDKADNLRSSKEILANAPETDGKYFIVPRII